jgi:hypothetical protein
MSAAASPTPSDTVEHTGTPAGDAGVADTRAESERTGEAEAEDADAEDEPAEAPTPSAGDWQAIFSPAHNAYYFFNAATQQTTWVNPLQPAPDASASAPDPAPAPAPVASTSTSDPTPEGSSAPQAALPPQLAQLYATQAAAAAAGIDPALAFLDPSLAAGGAGGGGAAYAASAKFNARTGAFARADARAPEHLSEHARAQRMSAFYFDTAAWEADVAKRAAEEDAEDEEARKRRRPSKKDLVRTVARAVLPMGTDHPSRPARIGLRSRRRRRSWPRRPGSGTDSLYTCFRTDLHIHPLCVLCVVNFVVVFPFVPAGPAALLLHFLPQAPSKPMERGSGRPVLVSGHSLHSPSKGSTSSLRR